jgi:hypothetical protein
MSCPSAVLGTTMKRRARGGTLSGSGASCCCASPPPLPGPARLQQPGSIACLLPIISWAMEQLCERPHMA